jgi:hypothetical protein
VGTKSDRIARWRVRRGVDILKARALGAQGPCSRTRHAVRRDGGRRKRGARRALEILSSELVRAMQLCGVRSIDEIGPALLAARGRIKLVVHLVDGTYELFRHFHGQRRFNKGQDAPFAP